MSILLKQIGVMASAALLALSWPASSFAQEMAVRISAVPAQKPRTPSGRYIAIPYSGDFEELFKSKLRAVREKDNLSDLLGKLKNEQVGDARKQAEDLFKQIDLDDPLIRELLLDALKKNGHDNLTIDDVKNLQKMVTSGNLQGPMGTGLGKNLGTNEPPRPPAGAPGRKGPMLNSEKLNRWVSVRLKDLQSSQAGEWLKNSPAFQSGLNDLKKLIDFDQTGAVWNMRELPDHLRFSEGWSLKVGEGLVDRLSNFSMPKLPRFRIARLGLGGWQIPALPLPNLGSPSSGNVFELLLWTLVIVVVLVLGWQIMKNLGVRKKALARDAGLGPWPVDPARVATRGQLIQAFEYLSLRNLGLEARTWNHRAIAQGLQEAARGNNQEHAAAVLGALYEEARYTHGAEALTDADQAAARRHLCLLAGATQA
ncbi:MAG: hypothetical protein L0Y72_07275 [Gemmataceae bacterium]|nr:hypothetical protein [Gemmataceae bacterium]MCI0738828.1 hypothetical protein [Gemmataceae bacterium]